jgi:hypothetical protein
MPLGRNFPESIFSRPSALPAGQFTLLDRILPLKKHAPSFSSFVPCICKTYFRVRTKGDGSLFAVGLAVPEPPELATRWLLTSRYSPCPSNSFTSFVDAFARLTWASLSGFANLGIQPPLDRLQGTDVG